MWLVFVLAGMICFGVYLGYPKYQIMKLEDQARSTLKSGGFEQFGANYRPLMSAAKIDFSVLDQYPNIPISAFICAIQHMRGRTCLKG